MRYSLSIFIFFGISGVAAPLDNKLKLDQAIDAVMAKPASEDFEVEIARTRVRLLETMSRRRVEFTPQIGLLALTNPVALATSLGAGLIWRQGAVAPLSVLDARIDLVGSEIIQRRRRFEREVAVTQSYFEMAEVQRLAREACASVSEADAGRDRIARDRALARITKAEVVLHEQTILERSADCQRAGRRLQAVALQLAFWVGGADGEFRVSEEPAGFDSLEYSLRPLDYLVQVALAFRREPTEMRTRISELRKQVDAANRPNPAQLSVRYSRLGRTDALGIGNGLIAGSGLQPELSLRFGMREGAELSAEKQLLLRKLDKLDSELEELEREIRRQITVTQIRFQASRDEITIARKRLSLAAEYRRIAATRYRANLEGAAYLSAAEDGERRAAMELARHEYSGKSSLATLLSICGLRGQPVDRQELLVARRFDELKVVQ